MGKSLSLATGVWLLVAAASGQSICPPRIQWQQSYGSSSDDSLYVLRQTPDDGFLLGGYSGYGEPDGTRTAPLHGQADFWLVRTDSTGRQLWDKSYGGSVHDTLIDIEQTTTGLLLGGWSDSPESGTKTNEHFGSGDAWIVFTDNTGAELWQRSFGGTGYDVLTDMRRTRDGGYILLMYSSSPGGTGNKTSTNFGSYDFWVVRLDEQGNKLWEQSYGGSESDIPGAIAELPDGSFILGGGSESPPDGNRSAPRRPELYARDAWLVRIDAQGNKVWDKAFDLGFSQEFQDVLSLPDGGYLVGGWTSDGDDYWVFRFDANDNELWQGKYGGNSSEFFQSFAPVHDGGFLLVGNSYSQPSGTKTSVNRGADDFWVVRIDANGTQLWDESYGGNYSDFCRQAVQTTDGGFLLAGTSSFSRGGNKRAPLWGQSDFWVVRLRPETPGDCDADGVPDAQDDCPDTPLGGRVTARGCTLEQSCPCDSEWNAHSHYVDCVRDSTAELVQAGAITETERQALIQQAQQTNCPPIFTFTNSIIVFGFTNVALGSAEFGTCFSDSGGSGGSGAFNDGPVCASALGFDGLDGMAILMGEAQSGLFVYPYATPTDAEYDPNQFVLGKAYGQLNHLNDRPLCWLRARKVYYENYPVDVDFTPLRPESLTFQVLADDAVVAETTVPGARGSLTVHSSSSLSPRANPFWRMPDGTFGALIEFTEVSFYASVEIPGNEGVNGNRIFVRPNKPANRAGFVSRFEIYGGGGLSHFSVNDARLIAFEMPHRATGPTLFVPSDGRLTLAKYNPDHTNDVAHGVFIELKETNNVDIEFTPITLNSNDYFEALFTGNVTVTDTNATNQYQTLIGSYALAHQGDKLEITSIFGVLDSSNQVVKIYRRGGTAAEATVSGNLACYVRLNSDGSTPRIERVGAARQNSRTPGHIDLLFDQLVEFALPDGLIVRGDLIRLQSKATNVVVDSVAIANMRTTVREFTIENETTRVLRPQLAVAVESEEMVLSWPPQLQPFALESAFGLNGTYTTVTNEVTTSADGYLKCALPLNAASCFYRLKLND